MSDAWVETICEAGGAFDRGYRALLSEIGTEETGIPPTFAAGVYELADTRRSAMLAAGPPSGYEGLWAVLTADPTPGYDEVVGRLATATNDDEAQLAADVMWMEQPWRTEVDRELSAVVERLGDAVVERIRTCLGLTEFATPAEAADALAGSVAGCAGFQDHTDETASTFPELRWGTCMLGRDGQVEIRVYPSDTYRRSFQIYIAGWSCGDNDTDLDEWYVHGRGWTMTAETVAAMESLASAMGAHLHQVDCEALSVFQDTETSGDTELQQLLDEALGEAE